MDCSCHCNGKCKLLGVLEQKIIDILWAESKPLKPSEVHKLISGDYAYTTIMTVLKRMSEKNILTRRPSGNSYTYYPNSNKHDFACSCLDDLFSRLIDSYGKLAVDRLLKVAKDKNIQ